MQWALTRLRVEDDGLILAPSKDMRTEPAKDDQFMLWQIIFASDDRVILHPDDELGEANARLIHSRLQGKQHLVGIEDVDAVFL